MAILKANQRDYIYHLPKKNRNQVISIADMLDEISQSNKPLNFVEKNEKIGGQYKLAIILWGEFKNNRRQLVSKLQNDNYQELLDYALYLHIKYSVRWDAENYDVLVRATTVVNHLRMESGHTQTASR